MVGRVKWLEWWDGWKGEMVGGGKVVRDLCDWLVEVELIDDSLEMIG